VLDGVRPVAFWKAAFQLGNGATVEDIPTYELHPVRRGSIRRRFTLLCWVACAACIVCAYTLKQYPANPGPNLIWFFFAMWPGGLAVLLSLGSWVITGRL
jgi:hypothetical protein